MHPVTHGTVVVTKTLQQTNLRDCFPAPSPPSPPPLPPRRVAWWVETMGDAGREGGEGVDRPGGHRMVFRWTIRPRGRGDGFASATVQRGGGGGRAAQGDSVTDAPPPPALRGYDLDDYGSLTANDSRVFNGSTVNGEH